MASISTCAAAAGAFALLLAGCQSGGVSGLFAGGGSPAGKPISVESIEGVPADVKTALSDELVFAAASRRVELVGANGEARYRIRGYLSTEQTADGQTQLAFVWDVFDAQKRRAKRVAGASPMRGVAGDGLDKEALRRLAAESMDGLASFLSANVAPPEPGEAEPDA